MTLDDLRRAVANLPDSASILLPVGELRGLLDGTATPETQQGREPLVDLTVKEAGDLLNRSPNTVRWWCRSGVLPGAYRLRGHEWRIPREAIRALRDGDHGKAQQGPKLARRHASIHAYKETG